MEDQLAMAELGVHVLRTLRFCVSFHHLLLLLDKLGDCSTVEDVGAWIGLVSCLCSGAHLSRRSF